MSEARGGNPKPFEFNAELTALRVSLEGLDDPLDDDKLFRTALPQLARTLRARRAGFWRFTADRTALVAALIYDRVSESWSVGETVTAADHPELWAVLHLPRPRRDLGGRPPGEPAPAADVAEAAQLAGHWATAAVLIGDDPAVGALWCEPDEGRAQWTHHELLFVEFAKSRLKWVPEWREIQRLMDE